MVNFNSILESCKVQDVHGAPLLSAGRIEEICQRVGYRWRDGKLPPDVTVQCMMQQMAHGNASCAAVRQMNGGAFSGEAFCQARQRLPLGVLEELNAQLSQAVMKKSQGCGTCRWKGHRVFIIDGSGRSGFASFR